MCPTQVLGENPSSHCPAHGGSRRSSAYGYITLICLNVVSSPCVSSLLFLIQILVTGFRAHLDNPGCSQDPYFYEDAFFKYGHTDRFQG